VMGVGKQVFELKRGSSTVLSGASALDITDTPALNSASPQAWSMMLTVSLDFNIFTGMVGVGGGNSSSPSPNGFSAPPAGPSGLGTTMANSAVIGGGNTALGGGNTAPGGGATTVTVYGSQTSDALRFDAFVCGWAAAGLLVLRLFI
jgi:hypothetical protein